jgi:catechol 2,3-dioxygenase-like lactoylglutathione lyase family enzyme
VVAVTIQFVNTLIMVKDIEVSKKFYEQTIGIPVVQDYGACVIFEGHLALHGAREFRKLIGAPEDGTDEPQGSLNMDVYFETDDLAGTYEHLCQAGVRLIHGIETQAWGQPVFRFYDPDGHVVEIGAPL